MATQVQTSSVSLTSSAANAVRDLLKERNLNEGYALRIFISGRGCSGFEYGIGFDDKAGETDTAFNSEGLKIIVDESSLQFMAGTMIDFIDDERGRGFLVENPNPAPACSCESGNCGADEI